MPLWGSWELRDPWFLLVALLAPMVYWLASRHPGVVTYSRLALLDQARRSWRVRLASLPALSFSLAALCIAIALAGPRTGDATTRVKREGVAMALVVDRSGSMDLVDGERNLDKGRLEILQDVLTEFVKMRPDDFLGLIAFAHYSDSLCPLTLDHGNLLSMIADLEIPFEEDERGATAIGEGLALACERLREQTATSKIVILLTDGKNTAGVVTPQRATELANELGIKVHTIGLGGTGRVWQRQRDPRTQKVIDIRQVRGESFDEKQLRSLADQTGGQYFHASDKEGLARVYAEIDAMERTEITEDRYMTYDERFVPWILAALALIGAATLGGSTLLRRLP